MKASKILVAGILAATALISTASAQTKVYITGSSAFRAAAVTGIGGANGNTPGGTGALAGSFTVASDNSDITSANVVTYTGGTIGGNPVTIKLSWSGSSGGYQTVSGGLSVKFLPDGATGTANTDIRVSGNGTTTSEDHVPDIGFGDTQQNTTPFHGGSYANLHVEPVGIVSFIFGASNGFPTGTSMSKKAFEYNFASGNGAAPLSWYTGLASDAGSGGGVTPPARMAYAVGRDPDSGTRATALAETGFGVNNAVQQFKPTVSSNNITALGFYSDTPVNGITYAGANMGESSGSSLRGYLNKTLTTHPNGETSSYVLTYLGVSDFLKTYTGTLVTDSTGTLSGSYSGGLPSVPMAWNGATFSRDAIANGSYTFWSTEYLTRLGGLSGDQLATYNAIVTAITGFTTSQLSGNVAIGDMQVQRSGDGGPITSLNF